ncbi:MAG: septum formation protein Maf [Alphaproteobacteria bacterium]|nr:septum formation protein Maf [Alphaproteobacteria bacterium]
MRLTLASASGTRRRMLEAAGVPFEVRPATVDEDKAKARLREEGLDAAALALALAELKAAQATAAADELVLGCDQTLERHDGSMIDKPRSIDEAAAQLRGLSGHRHRLHAAAVIVERGAVAWRAVESVELGVRRFSDDFLSSYLDREYDAIRHNVGGYRIEGLGVQLFDRIEGSHFAILGLPLLPLLEYLRERGVVPR